MQQQSIDISCPPDPQQQTSGIGFAAVGCCWDRLIDTVFHRPFSAYYAGSTDK